MKFPMSQLPPTAPCPVTGCHLISPLSLWATQLLDLPFCWPTEAPQTGFVAASPEVQHCSQPTMESKIWPFPHTCFLFPVWLNGPDAVGHFQVVINSNSQKWMEAARAGCFLPPLGSEGHRVLLLAFCVIFPHFPTVGQGKLSYGGLLVNNNPPPHFLPGKVASSHLLLGGNICCIQALSALRRDRHAGKVFQLGRVFSPLFLFPFLSPPPRNLSDIDMHQAASSIRTFARHLSLPRNSVSSPEKDHERCNRSTRKQRKRRRKRSCLLRVHIFQKGVVNGRDAQEQSSQS